MSKVLLNWNPALCSHHDMTFVNFASSGEANDYLKLNTVHWVGISDQMFESSFRNYDGKSDTVNSLLWWNTGEPNNYNGNEDCVQVENNKFNDNLCTTSFKIACMSK